MIEKVRKKLNKLAEKYPEFVFLCFEKEMKIGQLVEEYAKGKS